MFSVYIVCPIDYLSVLKKFRSRPADTPDRTSDRNGEKRASPSKANETIKRNWKEWKTNTELICARSGAVRRVLVWLETSFKAHIPCKIGNFGRQQWYVLTLCGCCHGVGGGSSKLLWSSECVKVSISPSGPPNPCTSSYNGRTITACSKLWQYKIRARLQFKNFIYEQPLCAKQCFRHADQTHSIKCNCNLTFH